MQLLVDQIKNKTTAPHILCNKFTLMILVVLFDIRVYVSSVTAELSCYQCRGINCLRTSYEVTQTCLNDLDICVNVYDGQTLLAQGCWEQLPEEVRNKCDSDTQCVKCNENLCNNLASSSFRCIQCDSNSDDSCRTNPLSLMPSRCGISRAPNEYCFAKQEDKRVIRGCSYTLEEQMSCLASDDCMICQPSDWSNCNNIEVAIDDGGSDSSGAGNESSGNDSDGETTGNGGSGNGSEGSGSEDGDSGGGSSGESEDGSSTGNNEDGASDSGHGISDGGLNGCSASVINTNILIYIIIAIFITLEMQITANI